MARRKESMEKVKAVAVLPNAGGERNGKLH